MRIRRSKYLFFYHRNFPNISLENIMHDNFEISKQIIAIAILFGKEIIISDEEYDFICSIKELDWQYVEDMPFKNLLITGIILTTEREYDYLLKREDQLINDKWHIYAALYNFMTKWRDVDVKFIEKNIVVDPEEEMKSLIDINGLPPSHFFRIENFKKIIKIEYDDFTDDEFFKILLKRKTSRNFDVNSKLSFKSFSNILKYTFGIHGYCNTFGKNFKSLKKTSPSGGGLHPTEVYLLVMRVEGLETGLYHFNTEDDSLYLMKSYQNTEAIEKARFFSAGQQFASHSSVLFFLSTRYYRNYWKYRKNTAAYSVTIRDAAHLCQNLYLICTKLGVGVFTAAINHSNIEEELGLDPYVHGINMMIGCGVVNLKASTNLEPNYDEFLE